tara:strand:+ start:854 stop:1795 length:942 start_codon:yes stop_codon:yes gene_type:complete
MVCVKIPNIVVVIAVLVLVLASAPVRAVENPKEKLSENNELNPSNTYLCQSQTRGFETALGIPPHLLTAISLAESGKWDDTNRALFAWPWTVMAKGKGHYLPSKAAAIAKVRILQAQGVKNIDVGCMQINLYYHPKAFEDLNAAFDPERNVGYAANFLAAINQSTLSWPQAAANYHSTTPSKNEIYLNKVLGLWQKVSNKSIRSSGFRRSPDPAYYDPIGRTAQAALLKSRFRARLAAERNAKKPEKKTHNLEAWRRGRFNHNSLQVQAALQKADRARKRKNYLNTGKRSFSTKRQHQLTQWRKNRSPAAFRK